MFISDRFSGLHSEFMMNLETGANQIIVLEKRIYDSREKVYQAKLADRSKMPAFREWYIGELRFISEKLTRLNQTIVMVPFRKQKHLLRA